MNVALQTSCENFADEIQKIKGLKKHLSQVQEKAFKRL